MERPVRLIDNVGVSCAPRADPAQRVLVNTGLVNTGLVNTGLSTGEEI